MDPEGGWTVAEDDAAGNLAAAGIRLPAARVPVFPARTKEATAAEIIRGTGQVSPAINGALRRLTDQGRVTGQGQGSGTRMMKGWRYSLAWPFDAIKEPVHAETGDGGPAWTRMERGY